MSAPCIEDARSGPAGKIGPHHRDRLAVVYIRQSTAYQVVHHQESTRLQYALQQRAVEIGWAPERVVVIDDDLGLSGASAEGRAGFQRLMAEVGMDHVGIILGVETSRLARSCRDWYHLLEVCALFRTLISDTVASLVSRLNRKNKPRIRRFRPRLRPHEWTIALLAD